MCGESPVVKCQEVYIKKCITPTNMGKIVGNYKVPPRRCYTVCAGILHPLVINSIFFLVDRHHNRKLSIKPNSLSSDYR